MVYCCSGYSTKIFIKKISWPFAPYHFPYCTVCKVFPLYFALEMETNNNSSLTFRPSVLLFWVVCAKRRNKTAVIAIIKFSSSCIVDESKLAFTFKLLQNLESSKLICYDFNALTEYFFSRPFDVSLSERYLATIVRSKLCVMRISKFSTRIVEQVWTLLKVWQDLK